MFIDVLNHLFFEVIYYVAMDDHYKIWQVTFPLTNIFYYFLILILLNVFINF